LSLFFLNAAGHYVPAFGAEIVKSNSLYAKNLKGVGKYKLCLSAQLSQCNVDISGIGNGWVDPKIQYGAYAEVGCVDRILYRPCVHY